MGLQRINKRGIIFQNALMAIVFSSAMIIAVGVIVNGWNTPYQAGLTYDLQEYDNSREALDNIEKQNDRLSPFASDPGTDFQATTFRGAYGVINDLGSSYRVVFGDNGMLDRLTNRFGMPDYIRIALFSAMVGAVIFGIVGLIFRVFREKV